MRYYSTQYNQEIFLTGTVEMGNGIIENAHNLTLQEIADLDLLPIEVVEPVFNPEYQFIASANYAVLADKVIKTYQVENNTAIYPDLVQSRLDTFAKEKDFDGINDACSYAFSTNLIWRAEAERAVELRDLTWQSFYATTSTDWLEIEAGLPVLSWND